MIRCISIALLACSTLLAAMSVFAQKPLSGEFTPPVLGNVNGGRFYSEVEREGWVLLNYTVSREGLIGDVLVLSSSGQPDFERMAIQRVVNAELTAAGVDGQAVNSTAFFLMNFLMEGQTEVRRNFAVDFSAFSRALERQDTSTMNAALGQMSGVRRRNNLETALLNMARFQRASLDGAALEQIQHLEQALMFRGNLRRNAVSILLPEELELQARRALFYLYAENNQFADALNMYEIIQRSSDSEGADRYRAPAERIREMQSRELTYNVKARTNDSGFWFGSLFKPGFSLTGSVENIELAELRCQTGRFRIAVEPDMDFEVPDGAGECNLVIKADAQMDFEFLQF